MTNTRAPPSRWDVTEARGAYASAAYGAFVVFGMFTLDAAAFGLSRMEAQTLEPTAMIVLETSYNALHDPLSGSMCRTRLTNMPLGFFLGAGGSVSSQGGGSGTTKAKAASSAYSGTSGAMSILSGRVSYTLGLTGACLTVDTACSSSLVAAHLAVDAIKLDEC